MKRVLVKTVHTSVLVVDDNEVNLLIAKTTLEQYGITVEAVQSGALALKKLETELYDLIILDCIMPEMDGHETARRIRALGNSRSSIPITTYTANNPEDVRREFEDVGVTDVLKKPLDTIELTKVLLKYLPNEKLLDKETVLAELSVLGSAVDTGAPAEKSELQLALETVPDLDYLTGLHYASDSEESYLRVVSAACESMRSIAVNVAFFARQLALGDNMNGGFTYGTDAFRVDAHSMKGVCASIGIDPLSKTSAEFEKYAKDNIDFKTVLPALCDYSNKLAETGNALFSAITDYKAKHEQKAAVEYVPMEKDKYLALWDEALLHVKRFEIDAIKDCLERLQASAETAELRTALGIALDASASFDYGKVTEILNGNRPE